MDTVANLTSQQRKELFGETANAMKATPAIAEKDFWVVWVLSKLFADNRLKDILIFKGGTSLSKVYNLIGRFSEDIDLILDWRKVTDDDPNEARSKTQQDQFNKSINGKAKTYINDELLPIISELLAPLCSCRIEKEDEFSILVTYPPVFSDEYLRPEILLEIGPLASWTPSAVFTIQPYAATHFPNVFKNANCQVTAILAERTFWEKATILHQEAYRDLEKSMPIRYSRHYYDLALLSCCDICDEALKNLKLLEDVVEFKQRFYPSSWSRYDLAKPGTFKLLPPKSRYSELEKDYQAMQSMIFDRHLTFDEIIHSLASLETEINELKDKA